MVSSLKLHLNTVISMLNEDQWQSSNNNEFVRYNTLSIDQFKLQVIEDVVMLAMMTLEADWLAGLHTLKNNNIKLQFFGGS